MVKAQLSNFKKHINFSLYQNSFSSPMFSFPLGDGMGAYVAYKVSTRVCSTAFI